MLIYRHLLPCKYKHIRIGVSMCVSEPSMSVVHVTNVCDTHNVYDLTGMCHRGKERQTEGERDCKTKNDTIYYIIA